MTFTNLIAIVAVGAITVGCLALLWAIVRFSIISPMRTRGADRRLRKPQPQEVEAKWKVNLPSSLVPLFREHPIVEKSEFYLAPDASDRDRLLYVYSFIPLTVLDVSEAKKSSGVPGIPIAFEDKGTYYLPDSALRGEGPVPVVLRQYRKDTQVAASVDEFFGYTVTEWPDDEETET
jgi:hypothetical protein